MNPSVEPLQIHVNVGERVESPFSCEVDELKLVLIISSQSVVYGPQN